MPFACLSLFLSLHNHSYWENKQGRGVLAQTSPPPHRPESLVRVMSSFKDNPNVLLPYRPPSHLGVMHGRWSGGVVRLPAEY